MTGYVHTINRRRGLVAIAADSGGFTIIELPGSDPISLGDRMRWDSDALDSAVYFNQTKASRVAVNVQAHGVPEALVRRVLRL
jgi:hypothetical protein